MDVTKKDPKQEYVRIAEQNDAFRKRQPGGGQGQIVVTRAVDAEGPEFVTACMAAVMTYDNFTEDNDPYETHEMGFMKVMDKDVWFKIDLYDRAYEMGSSEPTSLANTRRVLTILFPSDY